jgi:hypothetical protein
MWLSNVRDVSYSKILEDSAMTQGYLYQQNGSSPGTWLMGERMNEFCVCLIESPMFWVNIHDPVFYNHNTIA